MSFEKFTLEKSNVKLVNANLEFFSHMTPLLSPGHYLQTYIIAIHKPVPYNSKQQKKNQFYPVFLFETPQTHN